MRLCWSCIWACGKVSRVCSALLCCCSCSDAVRQMKFMCNCGSQSGLWQAPAMATNFNSNNKNNNNKLWSYRKVTIITPVPSIDLNFCWPNICLLLKPAFGKAMMTMMTHCMEVQIHNCFYRVYLNLNCHLYKYSRDFQCILFHIYLRLIIRNANLKLAHNAHKINARTFT